MAHCFWAEPPAYDECVMLKTWGVLTANTGQVDSTELAHLAAQKWEATCKWGTPISSLSQLTALIREKPTEEASGMLLAGAEWFEPGIIGVCLFHRTWSNNIFLDFLAAHPATIKPEEPIKGVGIGLLYLLCEISSQIGAPLIWGETTESSVIYYRKIFDLPELEDRLIVPAAALRSFCDQIRRKWNIPEHS